MFEFANPFGNIKALPGNSCRSVFAGVLLPRLITVWLVAMMLCGCATQTYAPENAPEYVIIRNNAPFYSLGPQQNRGPNLWLPLNMRVKLLRREMGFSLVQLANLKTGYLANENMAVAPPRPPSSGLEPSSRKSKRSSRSSIYQEVDDSLPDAPPPDLNLEPGVVSETIPLPTEPPTERPRYRY